jgi:hypothetical protein
VRAYCAVAEEVQGLLEAAMARLRLSARAYHRVLKLAPANADLAVSECIAAPIWPRPCSTAPIPTRRSRCARAVPRVAA